MLDHFTIGYQINSIQSFSIGGSFHHFNQQQAAIQCHTSFQLKKPEWGWRMLMRFNSPRQPEVGATVDLLILTTSLQTSAPSLDHCFVGPSVIPSSNPSKNPGKINHTPSLVLSLVPSSNPSENPGKIHHNLSLVPSLVPSSNPNPSENPGSLSEYECLQLRNIQRNKARMATLGLLVPLAPRKNTKRRKHVAMREDVVRRVQPKRKVSIPSSYKDLADPVIKRKLPVHCPDAGEAVPVSKRTQSVISPNTGEGDPASKRMHPEFSPSTEHSTDIYGNSDQYYNYQQKYATYLHELLSDRTQFPNFPRDSDEKVIADTHLNFAPPRLSEVIGDKTLQGTYGNFALELQDRKSICNNRKSRGLRAC